MHGAQMDMKLFLVIKNLSRNDLFKFVSANLIFRIFFFKIITYFVPQGIDNTETNC
jgi:hypothetical protein